MAERVFGLDLHPVYQRLFDFKRAYRAGFRFVIIKASQGDRYVPAGFRDFVLKAEDAGFLVGYYPFLERGPSGANQAEHFLDTVDRVGGIARRLVAVDFERYGDNGVLSPTNEQLYSCNSFLSKHLTGTQELGIYSTYDFWSTGDPSGPFAQYKAGWAWEARVWYNEEKRRFPRLFYRRWKKWYEHPDQAPRGLGGKNARMRQYTWGGYAGGLWVDTDCWEGTLDSLKVKAGIS